MKKLVGSANVVKHMNQTLHVGILDYIADVERSQAKIHFFLLKVLNNSMKYPMNAVSQAVEALLRTGAWKATKYISDKQVVRASRKTFNRKISKVGNVEIILTLGHPNYAERNFLKQCKKAGEPIPVKKVQLKYLKRRW